MERFFMNKELTQLWAKFEEHFGGTGRYQFGFRDRELFYSFSVMDLRTGKSKIEKVEMGHDINFYKKQWYQMMKQFEKGFTNANKTS